MEKKPNTNIECDLCHRQFQLSPAVLQEKTVLLTSESHQPHEVLMTVLTCPCCGKEYPVMVDDDTTLPIVEKLRVLLTKQVKQVKKGYQPNAELLRKKKQLNWKLDFKRQQLAEKYNGSFYQLEDGTTVQLDYRYHAR